MSSTTTCGDCQTYGDQFDSARKCKNKKEAQTWLGGEIMHLVENHGKNEKEARSIILSNLGYMAGYYNHSVSVKIHDLFGAEHPIFGPPSQLKETTAEQAFLAGVKKGEGK